MKTAVLAQLQWLCEEGGMEDFLAEDAKPFPPKRYVKLYTSLLKQFKLRCTQILRGCSLWAEVLG